MNNLTGTGADYCMYTTTTPTLAPWTQYNWEIDDIYGVHWVFNGHIDLIYYYQHYIGKNSRMVFNFNITNPLTWAGASYYNESLWGQMLQLFSQRGQKVTAANYSGWNSQGFEGSQAMRNYWLAFTSRWHTNTADGQKISAFQLSQEPTGFRSNGMPGSGAVQDWSTDMYTSGSPDRYKLAKYYVQLTHDIHLSDANRVVIYPYLGLSYYYEQAGGGGIFSAFNQIKSETGIDILNEPNIIFDVIHPYLFEYQSWETYDVDSTTAKAKVNTYIPVLENWKSALNNNTNKMWCGETGMFCSVAYETGYNLPRVVEIQRPFWNEMIKALVQYGVAVDVIYMLTWAPHYIDENYGCFKPSVKLPYYNQTECVAHGGEWGGTCVVEGSYLSSYTNQTTCQANGGTWTRRSMYSKCDEHTTILKANGFPFNGEQVTLPLTDNFATLGSKWQQLAGNWSVN